MKETVKINLNQRLFDLDADAYERLRNYLDSLSGYLKASAESADEVLQDIEQRIAEILEEKFRKDKQVVTLQDIEEVIKMMGTIDDFARESDLNDDGEGATGNSKKSASYEDYSKEHRKLYRDVENNILGGVCSGIAAYFNVDSVWIRLAFVVLFFINLVGLIIYLILWVVVPPAATTAQRLQMRGRPVTVENIQESVKSEFYKVKDNFRNYTHSEGFQKTRDTAGEVVTTMGNIFLVFLKVILILIGVALFVAVIAIILSFIATITAGGIWHGWHFPDTYFWSHLTPLFQNFTLFTLAFIAVILIPATAILTGIIKLIFNIKAHNSILSAFAWTIWALALVFVIISLLSGEHVLSVRHHYKDEVTLEMEKNKTLYIDLENELLTGRGLNYYSVFGKEIIRDKYNEICYLHPTFLIKSSGTDKIQLELLYNSVIPDFEDNNRYDREYEWVLNDTVLLLSNYLKIDEEDIWMLPGLQVILHLPEGQIVYIDNDIEEIVSKIGDNNKKPAWYYNNSLCIKNDELIPVIY